MLINARAETMMEKPTFREAAHSRRCVVLASGWYEWKAPKQPYYISRTDGAPMAFAGLYWGGDISSLSLLLPPPLMAILLIFTIVRRFRYLLMVMIVLMPG